MTKNPNQRIEDSLNEVAASYHLGAHDDMFIEEECQRYEVDWIASFVTRSTEVLDLGYGDGINFRELCGRTNLTLIEGASALVSQAHMQLQRLGCTARLVHSLFEEFESSEKFDVVNMSHILEHVENPVDILRRYKSFIKPGGVLIGIVPNANSFHRRLGHLLGLQERRDSLSARDLIVGHRRVYDLTSLGQDLNVAGFELSQHRGFFIKTFANSQMLWTTRDQILGLLKLSDEVPTDFCANIGFVARPLW